MWFLYVLQCSDGTYYTGITVNLEERIKNHNSSILGAKYTRGRRPVKLVYSKECGSRSQALKVECEVKKMSRKRKMRLIECV